MPYLFICALIANAASFVLPISNPANIVLYGDHTPSLIKWLASFALPSLAAIVATYVGLWLLEGRRLGTSCECGVDTPALSAGAWTALLGIGATAIVLLVVSAFDVPLGAPTCVMGLLTATVVWVRKHEAPWPTLKGVSWAVLPLVAGLFVLVQALQVSGGDQIAGRRAGGGGARRAHGDAVGPGRPDRGGLEPDEQPARGPDRQFDDPRGSPVPPRRRPRCSSASTSGPTSPSPGRSRPSSGSPPSAARAKTSASGAS